MKVRVCVDYFTEATGSTMLCKTLDLPVAPQVGDNVEVLPESADGEVSEWHELVTSRYVGPDNVEVHAYHRGLDDEQVKGLRDGGYRVPGE